MTTIDEAAFVANLHWERDPLSWLGILAKAKAYNVTLLEYVRRRIEQERERRRAS